MITANTNQGRKRRNRMWPSFETAISVYDKANLLLLVALVAGVIATALVVWMGNVKEEYLKRDIAESNKRAEEAKAASAEANARAAEATLALERFKAPRVLSPQEQQLIVSRVSKFAGQEYKVTTFWDLKEPLDFSKQLSQTLATAGWKFIQHGEGGSFLMTGLAGVQVWVHINADPQVMDAANALVSALEAIGKAPALKQMDPKSQKDNKIALNIGTKP